MELCFPLLEVRLLFRKEFGLRVKSLFDLKLLRMTGGAEGLRFLLRRLALTDLRHQEPLSLGELLIEVMTWLIFVSFGVQNRAFMFVGGVEDIVSMLIRFKMIACILFIELLLLQLLHLLLLELKLILKLLASDIFEELVIVILLVVKQVLIGDLLLEGLQVLLVGFFFFEEVDLLQCVFELISECEDSSFVS